MAAGWIDDSRTCVMPTCLMPAPAEPHQHDQLVVADRLDTDADKYQAVVDAKRAQAARIRAEAAKAATPAWLCAAHRQHLHDPNLATAWASSRHAARDRGLIERTVRYVEAHPPSVRGACSECMPGAHPSREEAIPA